MPLRTLFARRSLLVMSAATVLSVLGGSAAASAAVAAPPARQAAARDAALQPAATTVSWHKLTLQNGWKSARSSSYLVANPSYAISGGMVYLDGALYQPSSIGSQFAVLPSGYRPARVLLIAVYTGSNGTAGTLEIDPSGAMKAYNGDAMAVTSLATVSFPVAGMTWHTVALKNGWASSQSQWNTGNPAYAISSGIVHLAGSLHQASGTSAVFGTLPPAARPSHRLYINVHTYGGSTGSLVVYPDGTLYAYGPWARGFFSLAGVSFPDAALAWKALPTLSGWTSSQSLSGTGNPSYAVVGPIVYLSGSMHQASNGSAIFAIPPTAIKTPSDVLALTYTQGETYGALAILPALMTIVSNPVSNAQGFTSLAAISYPRNS